MYSGLFDLYIEGKPIPPEYKDDPVAGYIEEICQDSGNKELCRKEETWKEIFRKEIISMLEGILPVVSTIEREYEEEMKILSHFFASNIEQKRLAWNGIAKHLHDTFDSSMFNIHGYIQEFGKKQKTTDEIFDAMEANWKEASKKRKEAMKDAVAQMRQKGKPIQQKKSEQESTPPPPPPPPPPE